MGKLTGAGSGSGGGDKNPVSYLQKSRAGSTTSQIMKGAGGSGLQFGPTDGDRTVGTKRFDVTNRSLNRGSRGMK